MTGFDRRLFLLSALAALPACKPGAEGPAPCPEDPSRNGNVDWVPDVGRPVAWGEEHLTANDVPMPLSLYYPSARFIPPRPMLQRCAWRFPLVLFLHGDAPDHANTNYHRRWWRAPVALARSGHVVLVPNYTPGPAVEPSTFQPAIDWVLNTWSGAPWVNRRLDSRAVIGHSWGALAAARYAAANPDIGAFASLGGVFSEDSNPSGLISSIAAPGFYMFVKGNGFEDFSTSLFADIAPSHYLCSYAGAHFDYLDANVPGIEERGPCGMIADVAADLLALFVGSCLHSLTRIAVDLTVPHVARTPDQEALAVQFLKAQERVAGRKECEIDLAWRVAGTDGNRRIAP